MLKNFKSLLGTWLPALKAFTSLYIKADAKKATAMLMVLFALAIVKPVDAADITVFYKGLQQSYEPAPQIVNNRVLVPMRDIFEALGAEVSWDPGSRTAIACKDGKYVSVQIGSLSGIKAQAVLANGKYLPQNPEQVKLDAAPVIVNDHTMIPLRFVSESLGADVKWFGNTRQIFIKPATVAANPPAANQEMRGVWLTFNSLANFDSASIDAMLDKAVDMRLNTVFVHARAYSDAFYKSELFPWSHYLTGVQGQAPALDPLEYVVAAAHKRGLRVEAWVNPYRISTTNELTNSLAPGNPAFNWLNDPSKVIHYQVKDQNCLIYNPASQEVRNLITAGILEIVNNYAVDGVHFDDYFYVTGMKEAYDNATKQNEVNKLVQQVYAAVKAANPALSFGISPAGNIANCYAAGVDLQTWLSQDGYVDYVCPQIYWSNENQSTRVRFDNCLNDWLALKQNNNVKMYAGLALYRVAMTIAGDPGWLNRSDNLVTQVQRLRSTGECSGFILFDMSNLMVPHTQTELTNLKNVL